jgi:hypothetical protein
MTYQIMLSVPLKYLPKFLTSAPPNQTARPYFTIGKSDLLMSMSLCERDPPCGFANVPPGVKVGHSVEKNLKMTRHARLIAAHHHQPKAPDPNVIGSA